MKRCFLWFAGGIAALVLAPGQAPASEIVLHRFSGLDGSSPYAGVVGDSSGNLYGTTYYGGTAGAGVVFKLDASHNETVLYSFTGGADGANPFAGVIRDSSGNLYGTAAAGGSAGVGVVYKLDTTGKQTVLYTFLGGVDGAYPQAGVIRDSAGNLYGTTISGGAAGAGVVYKVDTGGNETVLYSFKGYPDGQMPEAGVIRDSAGNLYGATFWGGTAAAGMVYKLDAKGNETVLYNFTGGADGCYPYGGVIRDSAGNLYGTTYQGGTAGGGVVFKLDASGHESVLHTFGSGTDGYSPWAGVVRDSAGNLYGTAFGGGTGSQGIVYKLDTSDQETVLYSFTGRADGGNPYGRVLLDSAGNLYGTANLGGKNDNGVIFKIKP